MYENIFSNTINIKIYIILEHSEIILLFSNKFTQKLINLNVKIVDIIKTHNLLISYMLFLNILSKILIR
jgi:hypothetical protein